MIIAEQISNTAQCTNTECWSLVISDVVSDFSLTYSKSV